MGNRMTLKNDGFAAVQQLFPGKANTNWSIQDVPPK